MFLYLLEKAAWLVTVIVSLGLSVIFVSVHYFVHRYQEKKAEKGENEAANLVGHLTGMLYSVLLAFISVSSWANYDNAMKKTDEEVSSLSELYRISFGFPSHIHKEIEVDISRYAG